MSFKFTKEERLCNFHHINSLFDGGSSFVKYPFRVVYRTVTSLEQFPAQVMVSVSKKRFKRANKRNLIRRKIKEAYRLNKETLYTTLEKKNTQLIFALIYLPTEILTYSEIEKGVKKVINHFEKLNFIAPNDN